MSKRIVKFDNGSFGIEVGEFGGIKKYRDLRDTKHKWAIGNTNFNDCQGSFKKCLNSIAYRYTKVEKYIDDPIEELAKIKESNHGKLYLMVRAFKHYIVNYFNRPTRNE